MTTRVVDVRRVAFDVYIGRAIRAYPAGSPWGNPFRIGKDGTREEVIAKYRDWVLTSRSAKAIYIREHVHELRGRRLGCWCHPAPCHGDVLAELAERL